MEQEKFSISYNLPLQDIAGNILDVKITTNSYDPVAAEMVAKIADKVVKEEKSNFDVFKINTELANQAHAVPMVAGISSISPAEFNIPRPALKRSVTYDA
jgi:hypothetical protein